MRELRQVLAWAVAVKFFDRFANTPMKVLAALHQQAAVGNVLNHRMLEDVRRLGEQSMLVDDLQRFQFSEQTLELARQSSHPLEQSHDELSTDYGGKLNRSLSIDAEPIETRHDDVLHGVRDAQIRERPGHPVVPVLTRKKAQVDERLGHLLDEQWYSFGLLLERGLEFLGKIRGPEHLRRHLQGLSSGKVVKI